MAGWQGRLDLEFVWDQDKTLLIPRQMVAPLKVQRPFYPEGNEVCHSVILHTAGGVVGGDRLTLSVDLHPQSQALLTTAAASKIYRSSGAEARQAVQIVVKENASLEWLPQETIVFNGAIYRQDLRVELFPGATWLAWEITRLGRTASRETFTMGEWRSQTEVWQQGRCLWIDRQLITGGSSMLDSPHGLAGYPVIGSLVWLGKPFAPEWMPKLREHLPYPYAGATRLPEGLLCRYRGSSTAEVREGFQAVWRLLRRFYFNRDLPKVRIWVK